MMKSVVAKPSSASTKIFTAPTGEEIFQHGDGALAVGACGGHSAVHRQRGKERDENQNQRGEWRKYACGEEGDAGLVAEGGEIIDACQTHDAAPGVLGFAGFSFGLGLAGGAAVAGNLEVGEEP